MIENVTIGLGIVIISIPFVVYFHRFWKVYLKQQEMMEYMESDEYKNTMEQMKQLRNKDGNELKDSHNSMFR
jgi:hypothetical protein